MGTNESQIFAGIKNMELRLLRYFLTVAKEQGFTRAAEQLHITQPTLSRQMAAFEEELGITLFIRSGKKISLTDEGILLKRRALEILNLEEKTLEELNGKTDVVEGTITIGCGEFAAVETLAKICKHIKKNIRGFRSYCILQQQMQCMR